MIFFLLISFFGHSSLINLPHIQDHKFLSKDFTVFTKGWKPTDKENLRDKKLMAEYYVSKPSVNAVLTIRKLKSKKPHALDLKKDFIHAGFHVEALKRLKKDIFLFELSHKKTKKHLIQLSFFKKDKLIVLTCKSHKDDFSKIRSLCIQTLNTFQWL